MRWTCSSEELLDARARDEVASFARKVKWTWFVGLTFAHPVRDLRAGQKIFREFARKVAQGVFAEHFRYLVVAGIQPSLNYHFHVLIEAPPSAAARGIHEGHLKWAWRETDGPGGRFDIRPYNPALKAVEYMIHQHPEWDFSIACTRDGACAHRPCALERAIWRTAE